MFSGLVVVAFAHEAMIVWKPLWSPPAAMLRLPEFARVAADAALVAAGDVAQEPTDATNGVAAPPEFERLIGGSLAPAVAGC